MMASQHNQILCTHAHSVTVSVLFAIQKEKNSFHCKCSITQNEKRVAEVGERMEGVCVTVLR